MKFITFKHAQKTSWGIYTEHGIIDLGKRIGADLKTAIAQQRLNQLATEFATSNVASNVDYSLDEVELLPPIPNPEKIICIGVNYANRNTEYKDNSEAPQYPSVFMRTPDSLTAHNQPLIRPPESVQLDYEGEIVAVIGKPGRRIAKEDAYQHIAGLSIMNEGTLRDWVRHAKFNVTQGKNFYHSGSLGPWLVSADEFSANDYENIRIKTWINNELRQDDTTANMMFPIDYIIHYLSTFYTLKAGDVIATGTPNGAGARFDPPKYLKPGDTVTVEVEGVGKLINSVEDEHIEN